MWNALTHLAGPTLLTAAIAARERPRVQFSVTRTCGPCSVVIQTCQPGVISNETGAQLPCGFRICHPSRWPSLPVLRRLGDGVG